VTPSMVFDDARLLDAWDRAARLERPWRELVVLEGASGVPLAELARLPIGERDRRLLTLRISAFGAELHCETGCPSCGTRLELSVDAREMLMPEPELRAEDFEVSEDESTVRFRPPDSLDIAACLAHASADSDVGSLLAERCVEVVAVDGQASSAAVMSPRIRQRVAEKMAVLDAQADLQFDVHCDACDHRWQSAFDPAAFLLAEVDAYAARLIGEVHQLARAYGWSESSILAMSAARRRRYLSLVLQ
jgi:hypothetical protein